MPILCKMCKKRYTSFLDHRKMMQIHFWFAGFPINFALKNEKSTTVYLGAEVAAEFKLCFANFLIFVFLTLLNIIGDSKHI